MKYVFGPVSSRRLGQSLGIVSRHIGGAGFRRLVPRKTKEDYHEQSKEG
jgi:hypothetical protein